jgi:hypothetical protein
MNDDWRLRVILREQGFAHRLSELLTSEELEHDLESSFHDRVVVSIDGPELFCYTGTRGQAEAVERLIRELAAKHHWDLEVELGHWHPTAEEWQDPDAPLPADPARTDAERERRVAQERIDSADQGYPEFEVRIQCRSRQEAGELSHRLDGEGMPNLHRWSYVLVGAADEDSAQALAERLRGEIPAGSTVTVERNQRAVYEDRPWSPFALLGGLAG